MANWDTHVITVVGPPSDIDALPRTSESSPAPSNRRRESLHQDGTQSQTLNLVQAGTLSRNVGSGYVMCGLTSRRSASCGLSRFTAA